MKENTKHSDRFRKGIVFVIYITLFLTSITCATMIQINLNSSEYALNIEYEQHTSTGNGFSLDHSYRTIIVNIPITADEYESELSGITVGNFPFWVDTSDWVVGETVTISGNLYSIVSETGRWRVRRSFGDYASEDIWYHKELGIFIESNTDQLTTDSSGWSGSDVDIEIQQSNIDGFVARVTGSNVISNIAILSLVFIELMIIQGLWEWRRGPLFMKQVSD